MYSPLSLYRSRSMLVAAKLRRFPTVMHVRPFCQHERFQTIIPQIPMFDTYQLVEKLRENGFSKEQSTAVMEALLTATGEAHRTSTSTFSTKEESTALKSQVHEKLFNSQLKADIELKHIKELMQSNKSALQSDIAGLERQRQTDREVLRSELKNLVHELEKRLETQEVEHRGLYEKFENRLIKGTTALVFTVVALGLSAVRIFGLLGPKIAEKKNNSN
eukprot:986334_1